MSIVMNNVVLSFLRLAACTGLFYILRLSRFLDTRWPDLGLRVRRLVLFVWWNVAMRLGARLRNRLRGDANPDSWKARAPNLRPDIRRLDVGPDRISLPVSDAPVVSVIIPTYGKTPFTLRCLASIQANAPRVPIEVIVVDDAYPGTETSDLARVRSVILLRNETNLGFIRSCNAASRAARGRFLMFLNNDTQVLPDWLDTMIAVFHSHPGAGLVGSKLLSEDGLLQEAGGIIWKDGSGWNFGRGHDPGAPEFNYLREVDYCSGASLLVRRDVFLGVDGFDEKYAPAYCEDSDLAFRLRELGLRTYYQPRSEIIHFEGVSHGRDLQQGVKSCQVTNQAVFLQTWHEELACHHFLNGTHVMRARDRANGRAVVLVIDHYIPEPDRDAGSRTMMAFIGALLSAGLVVKFWPFNLYPTPGYTQALQDMGVEVFHGPEQPPLPAWLRTNGGDLDLVLLSRPDVADMLLRLVRDGTSATIAYYGHDLHFRRMRSRAELTGDPGQMRAANAMREREIAIWRDADIVLYPSEEEAAIVRDLAPGVTARAVIPYTFEEQSGSRGLEGRESWILFVAGFGHPPNAEAAVWFAREVLPLIMARVPSAKLAIVGSKPSAAVIALTGPNVGLFADVTNDELHDWYERARVAVVPLLTGAGVKLKTVEALWHGLPAVVTPVGAQGLPGVERIVPVETDAAAFAAAVSALLEEDALWRRQSAAQTGYAHSRFNAAAFRRSLLRVLEIEDPTVCEAIETCEELAAVA